jgi:transcriptional regulator with XRE-family HTH domain
MAETFGERLQRLRNEAGLTQMGLADRAGVPLTSLRNWEHDRREPLVSVLFKLATALGVDCRAFADCIGQPEPPKKTTRKRKEA